MYQQASTAGAPPSGDGNGAQASESGKGPSGVADAEYEVIDEEKGKS